MTPVFQLSSEITWHLQVVPLRGPSTTHTTFPLPQKWSSVWAPSDDTIVTLALPDDVTASLLTEDDAYINPTTDLALASPYPW